MNDVTPRADPNCNCICHVLPGITHIVPCCTLPEQNDLEKRVEDLEGTVEWLYAKNSNLARTHLNNKERVKDLERAIIRAMEYLTLRQPSKAYETLAEKVMYDE